jgi:hypothetical protein
MRYVESSNIKTESKMVVYGDWGEWGRNVLV